MGTTWLLDRTRRRFLQKAGAAAALGPLIISDRTIAQTRTLYVNSWGGSYTAAQDAAFFKPFTAATGIQIRTVTPVAYGKIKAQVQSRTYEFDMTSVNSMQWLRASREGLAEPIDWTIVKKDALPPNAVVADGFVSHKIFWERRSATVATNIGRGVPALGRTSGTLSGFPATAACA